VSHQNADRNSGKPLSVRDQSTADGARISQYTDTVLPVTQAEYDRLLQRWG
jgi:hypothetical protein